MAKKTLTGLGLEPETSGSTYQHSSHLSYPTLWMVAVPNSQLVFAGLGAPVASTKPVIAVHPQGSRPRFHWIPTTDCCRPDDSSQGISESGQLEQLCRISSAPLADRNAPKFKSPGSGGGLTSQSPPAPSQKRPGL